MFVLLRRLGECFGLLGINGAGKTTTMKMLVGEIAPTQGTAELCGYDMMQEPTKVRRLLGMCPQTHALLDLLTVREHLELFGRIKVFGPLCFAISLGCEGRRFGRGYSVTYGRYGHQGV